MTGMFGMTGPGRENTSQRYGVKEASPKVTLAVAEATAVDEAAHHAPTASAPPHLPNALSLPSDSALLAARLYLVVSTVLPNPAVMQPGVAGEGPHLYRMYLPTNLGIQVTWLYWEVKRKMPRLREDADKCAQLSPNTCTEHKSNQGETQVLLREVFQPDGRDKIMSKDAELAQQVEGNRKPWPANNLSWDIIMQRVELFVRQMSILVTLGDGSSEHC